MQRKVEGMQEHYIVCGYGRVGRQVVQELQQNHVEVVVVDIAPALVPELDAAGCPYVIGDASDDTVLQQAGLGRARGLCACLASDADNLFVVLTARTFNRELVIIARSNTAESERKLRIAGADFVINPYTISGHRMARQLLHPNVVEFMDVVMRRGQLEFLVEEIVVGDDSPLTGKTIAECQVRGRTGANVLAVRRAQGHTFTNLADSFLVQAHDTLIALGTPNQLEALSKLAADQRKRTRQRP